MLRFIINRLLLLIPTMLGITLIVLFFITITPGDPVRAMAGDQLSEEEMEELRASMGLKDPSFVRYVKYIKNV